MKKLLPAIPLLLAAAKASAQLVYEPFGYTYVASPPSILDGQTNAGNGLNWSKMSANPDMDDDILIANSNLTYTGLAASTGNSVTYGGAGASERLSLGEEFHSGSLYYSMVFQLTSTAPVGTGAYVAGFSNFLTSDTPPQSVGTRLFVKQGSSASKFKIGVTKNSNNEGDVIYTNSEYSLNTPIFVVGNYQIVGDVSGTDDIAKLYVKPLASDFGAAAAPTTMADDTEILTAKVLGSDLINTSNVPTVEGFVLHQQNTGVPNVQVDELRIDRTWAQVTPPGTAAISWTADASGAWSEDGKWSSNARPNAAAAFVNFPSTSVAARTVNVDGSYALRTINFTGVAPYTLSGNGTLNFSTSAAVNVMAGNQSISAAINMDGDLLASVRSGSTLAMSGTITSNGNSLMKAGTGTLQLANARFNELNIVGGKTQIIPSGTVASVSRVHTLTISNSTIDGVATYNAQLDLTNNDMVIDYAPGQSPVGTWNGTAYTGIQGAIQSGRNGGAWNGNGIVTSQSSAQPAIKLTTLGVAEASDALGLTGTMTALWRNQTVDASSLLVRYTYAGDANLDAKINADDYFIIDRNHNHNGEIFGYAAGDFDYNGQINGDDYFIIDTSFAAQSGPPPGSLAEGVQSAQPVPEPGAIVIVGMAAAMGLRRRRR